MIRTSLCRPERSPLRHFHFPHRPVLLLAAAVIFLSAAAPPRAAGADDARATVTNVHDGDTIDVDWNGRLLTVRLIGVDTPETARPDTPVQFHGPEATDFTRRALLGQRVRLEFEAPDRPGGGIDKYGRTLAYVLLESGTLFNLELVRLGHGRTYRKYPFRYEQEFVNAETAARAAGLGMWDRARRKEWEDPGRRGTIIGNVRSRIYHLPGQDGHDKVQEKNRIYFRTEQEAQDAGFRKARSGQMRTQRPLRK